MNKKIIAIAAVLVLVLAGVICFVQVNNNNRQSQHEYGVFLGASPDDIPYMEDYRISLMALPPY